MTDQSNKAQRAFEEVQRDYVQVCTKAGQLQYQIHVLTQDLERLNEQLINLNFEANASREVEARIAAEMKAKAAAAAAPAIEVPVDPTLALPVAPAEGEVKNG